MSDTVEAKYVGPDTEGVTLEPKVGVHDGPFVCPHGEWLALPADLVNGTDHTYDLDYEIPEDGRDADSDFIVEHGIGALTAQTYTDADGNVRACWETRATKTKKPEPAAPATEGLNDGDS